MKKLKMREIIVEKESELSFLRDRIAGLEKANVALRAQVKDLSDHLDENREVFMREKISLLNDNIKLLEKMRDVRRSSEYVLLGVRNFKFKVTTGPFCEVSYNFLLNGTRYGDSILFQPPKESVDCAEAIEAVNTLLGRALGMMQNLAMEASEND